MKKVLLAIAGLSFIAGMGHVAQAAVDYHYRYVADQPTYNVAPGGTVTVQLYLQETSDAPPASLLVDAGGLGQGALSVARNSGTATVSDPAVDAAFDLLQFPDSTSTTADLWGIASVGVLGSDQGGGVSQVLIGTITIHAGDPGDSAEFVVMPHANGGASITFDSVLSYNLDSHADPNNPGDAADLYTIAGSSNFTVITAVPEPVALLGAGVGLCALMLRRRQEA